MTINANGFWRVHVGLAQHFPSFFPATAIANAMSTGTLLFAVSRRFACGTIFRKARRGSETLCRQEDQSFAINRRFQLSAIFLTVSRETSLRSMEEVRSTPGAATRKRRQRKCFLRDRKRSPPGPRALIRWRCLRLPR